MRAEGDLARRFGLLEVDPRLEPLARAVDQSHQRHGRSADLRREQREVVERSLGGRVEHAVALEGREPLGLVLGKRRVQDLAHVRSGERNAIINQIADGGRRTTDRRAPPLTAYCLLLPGTKGFPIADSRSGRDGSRTRTG